MIHGVSAQGISLRPYFNRYTEDAIDLCDALSSFSPQGKTTLHEISRVMSLPGKPKGIDGGEVERYFHEGKIKEIADYCETDIVNTYRVWLRTARHRKRYLMPAARINLSFELSSAVTYMSISAGVIGIGLIASCFSLCCIAGVASTLVAVEWNFSTIARAV
jgi:Predicted 3'-5' exonuclease related to the exonuclease domain of PolB